MIAYLNNSTEGLEYKVEEISQKIKRKEMEILEEKKLRKLQQPRRPNIQSPRDPKRTEEISRVFEEIFPVLKNFRFSIKRTQWMKKNQKHSYTKHIVMKCQGD